MKLIQPLLATLIFALCSSVASADSYMGLGIGKFDYDADHITNFEKSSAFEIHYGNDSNKIAYEIGYLNMGDADDDAGLPVWTISGTSLSAAMLAKTSPSNNFDIFAKIGLHSWDVEIDRGNVLEKVTDDGMDLFYGFGGTYKINDKVGLGARYTIYPMDDVDASIMSLNLQIGL